MNVLPRIPVPPAKLGRLQYAMWKAVSDMAVNFDMQNTAFVGAVQCDPRGASITMTSFIRANPGLDEYQIKRTAQALISRRILKESKVGWSLHDDEFARLERQHRHEREGFRGD